MKNATMKKLFCAVLAVLTVLTTLSGCTTEPTPTTPPTDKEDPTMDIISLNGQWDFYRDSTAPVGYIRNNGVIDSSVSLHADKEITTTLTLDRPEQYVHAKLSLDMSFGGDLVTEGGEIPTVYAKIGEGDYFATPIEDYTHNLNSTLHTIDVGLYFADLVKGENTVTVKTNVKSGAITLSGVSLCYYPTMLFESTLQKIAVPGVWETQLGADYTAYNGVGWYKTSFDLPRTATQQQYVLTLGAVDYYAEIWVNDRFICSHEDGYSPIVIDLAPYSDMLQTANNTLVVRVTDQDTAANATFPLKQTLAGFYHDSVGINFGGIWNDVTLTKRGQTRIADVAVLTDIDTMSAAVSATLKSTVQTTDVDAKLSVLDGDTILDSKTIQSISVGKNQNVTITSEHTIQDGALWNISAPKVYTLRVELLHDGAVIDTQDTTFGFTDIRVEEDKILFNNRAIKVNGVLSWLGNWDQISPKFDPDFFTTQIRALKAYGFNCIKFCLVVPTEEILDICDREGIYVYIEYPVWNPVQTDAFYERAYSQIGRFLNMSKNHPCVIMSDFNCEMQGFEDPMLDFMNWCVDTGKQIDPNRLYADNSSTGRQNTDGNNDFWTWHPYTNALGFADYAKSIVAHRTAYGVKPLVFGEYADYPALADFEKVIAANGGKDPWNWSAVDDPFRADIYLKNLGYSDEQIKDMIVYSQKNCVDMKMYYVQETKKADSVAAYFLTIIQDIGHSVAGFFDELGDPKFTPEQTAFLRESVLLMDTNVYNFVGGKQTTLTPAISHYDGNDITDGALYWSLVDKDGAEVAGDLLEDGIDLENGTYHLFDQAKITMPTVDRAAAYTLTLTLQADDDYTLSSSWEVYLYPETTADDVFAQKTVMVSGSGASALKKRHPSVTDWKNGANPDLLIAFGSLTDAQLQYLKNGGKVLYLGTGSQIAKVEKSVYYSQYVMVHFPQQDHEIVQALDSKGFGGLQFLHMQTEYIITERMDTPLTHSIIGKLLLRDNVPDIGQSGSYMSEFSVGNVTAIQCTLNLSGDSTLGNYLIDVAAEYLLD